MHLPPSVFLDSSKGICPFETNDSKNETLGQGATFAFGPKKKYYFLKKLQRKTFLSPKTIHRFSKNKMLDNIHRFSTKTISTKFLKMSYHFETLFFFDEK